jgi:hypothetical protein
MPAGRPSLCSGRACATCSALRDCALLLFVYRLNNSDVNGTGGPKLGASCYSRNGEKEEKSKDGVGRMAGTPTLPKNREESGTQLKTFEKAGPPASARNP